MCGVVGVVCFGPKLPNKEEVVRQDSSMYLATELLQLTRERGEDATGIATLFGNGVYHLLKMGTDSASFTTMYGGKDTHYDGYLAQWKGAPVPAVLTIGHCRKSSVGSAFNNMNNHPIRVKDTMIVHNGTLKNYEQIFQQLGGKRDGTVDSEAIARLIDHYSNNGAEPYSTSMLEEVTRRLDGSFAVLAMNGNNPYQLATFRDTRPLEFALLRPLKLLLVASDVKFLKQVLFAYNNMARLYHHRNFVPLNKSDVVFDTLRHNGQAIFDLTREVESDTRVGDLCDEATIPYQRIWKIGTKPVTIPPVEKTAGSASGINESTKRVAAHSSAVVGGHGTARHNTHTGQGGIDLKKVKGLVWIEGYGYADLSEAEKTQDKKTGELILLATNTVKTKEEEGLSLRPAETVENVVADPVKVTEQKPVIDAEFKEVNVSRNTVDMTIDPQALEEADKAAKGLPTLENLEDLQELLEIVDLSSLKALPPEALANRVRRHAFKAGYYEGMVHAYKSVDRETAPADSDEHTSNNDMAAHLGAEAVKKLRKAQTTIRLLKATLMMMATITSKVNMETCSETPEKRLKTAAREVAKQQAARHGLTGDVLTQLLTQGDLRNEPIAALQLAVTGNLVEED